jgi:hypothetical protein
MLPKAKEEKCGVPRELLRVVRGALRQLKPRNSVSLIYRIIYPVRDAVHAPHQMAVCHGG